MLDNTGSYEKKITYELDMSGVMIVGNQKDNLTFQPGRKVNMLYLEYNGLLFYNLQEMKCN